MATSLLPSAPGSTGSRVLPWALVFVLLACWFLSWGYQSRRLAEAKAALKEANGQVDTWQRREAYQRHVVDSLVGIEAVHSADVRMWIARWNQARKAAAPQANPATTGNAPDTGTGPAVPLDTAGHAPSGAPIGAIGDSLAASCSVVVLDCEKTRAAYAALTQDFDSLKVSYRHALQASEHATQVAEAACSSQKRTWGLVGSGIGVIGGFVLARH